MKGINNMSNKNKPTVAQLITARNLEVAFMVFLDNPLNSKGAMSLVSQLLNAKEAKAIKTQIDLVKNGCPMVQKEFRNITLESIDAIDRALKKEGCVLEPVLA
jgi:hypothetical protein